MSGAVKSIIMYGFKHQMAMTFSGADGSLLCLIETLQLFSERSSKFQKPLKDLK